MLTQSVERFAVGAPRLAELIRFEQLVYEKTRRSFTLSERLDGSAAVTVVSLLQFKYRLEALKDAWLAVTGEKWEAEAQS